MEKHRGSELSRHTNALKRRTEILGGIVLRLVMKAVLPTKTRGTDTDPNAYTEPHLLNTGVGVQDITY